MGLVSADSNLDDTPVTIAPFGGRHVRSASESLAILAAAEIRETESRRAEHQQVDASDPASKRIGGSNTSSSGKGGKVNSYRSTLRLFTPQQIPYDRLLDSKLLAISLARSSSIQFGEDDYLDDDAQCTDYSVWYHEVQLPSRMASEKQLDEETSAVADTAPDSNIDTACSDPDDPVPPASHAIGDASVANASSIPFPFPPPASSSSSSSSFSSLQPRVSKESEVELSMEFSAAVSLRESSSSWTTSSSSPSSSSTKGNHHDEGAFSFASRRRYYSSPSSNQFSANQDGKHRRNSFDGIDGDVSSFIRKGASRRHFQDAHRHQPHQEDSEGETAASDSHRGAQPPASGSQRSTRPPNSFARYQNRESNHYQQQQRQQQHQYQSDRPTRPRSGSQIESDTQWSESSSSSNSSSPVSSPYLSPLAELPDRHSQGSSSLNPARPRTSSGGNSEDRYRASSFSSGKPQGQQGNTGGIRNHVVNNSNAFSTKAEQKEAAKNIQCKFWAVGNCKRGDTCFFMHSGPQQPIPRWQFKALSRSGSSSSDLQGPQDAGGSVKPFAFLKRRKSNPAIPAANQGRYQQHLQLQAEEPQ